MCFALSSTSNGTGQTDHCQWAQSPETTSPEGLGFDRGSLLSLMLSSWERPSSGRVMCTSGLWESKKQRQWSAKKEAGVWGRSCLGSSGQRFSHCGVE